MNHPVQLWEPELVSTIQRQQAAIRSASAKQQHQLIPDQQAPLISSNSNMYHHRHLLEPLSPLMGQSLVRKSRSTDVPSGEREAPGNQRMNQSAKDLSSEDSWGQGGRISSGDATLKGHLGHLAAAVADAHRKEVVEDKNLPTADVDKGKVVEDKKLLTTDVDIHFCKNCDKILSQEEDIEQHDLSCIKLS